MGPFTLLDFVGLDTTYYIANIMFEEFREPAYAPPPLLKRMVLAGTHGAEVGPRASIRTDARSTKPRNQCRVAVFVVQALLKHAAPCALNS